MPIDGIAVQNTQISDNASTLINQNAMGIRIISLIQGFSSLLIIVGLIVGIIYMIKSKKSNGKKILIGVIIIIVPFILSWILNIIKFNMLLNM